MNKEEYDYKGSKKQLEDMEKHTKAPKKKKVSDSIPTGVQTIRVSGIKNGNLLFRSIGNDGKFNLRLVPVEVWNGADNQEFEEKEFSDFKKPVFYKGE